MFFLRLKYGVNAGTFTSSFLGTILQNIYQTDLRSRKIKDAKKKLENHLRLFVDSPDYSKRNFSTERITTLVQQGAKLIDELSEIIAQ